MIYHQISMVLSSWEASSVTLSNSVGPWWEEDCASELAVAPPLSPPLPPFPHPAPTNNLLFLPASLFSSKNHSTRAACHNCPLPFSSHSLARPAHSFPFTLFARDLEVRTDFNWRERGRESPTPIGKLRVQETCYPTFQLISMFSHTIFTSFSNMDGTIVVFTSTQLLIVGDVVSLHFIGMKADTFVWYWRGNKDRLVGNAHQGGLSESPLRRLARIVVLVGEQARPICSVLRSLTRLYLSNQPMLDHNHFFVSPHGRNRLNLRWKPIR